MDSADEALIVSLSFRRPSSGQYVIDRRRCTFHAEGSNSYSAARGYKSNRFRIAGERWLGPSAFRIMCDVVNDDAAPCRKEASPNRKGSRTLSSLKN